MASRSIVKGRLGEFIGDALLGLALFVVVAALLGGDGRARAETNHLIGATIAASADGTDSGRGSVVGLISQSDAKPLITSGFLTARPVGEPPQTSTRGVVVLALICSALFAFNLGFWRHLRRTYEIIPG